MDGEMEAEDDHRDDDDVFALCTLALSAPARAHPACACASAATTAATTAEIPASLTLSLERVARPECECVRRPRQCDLWAFVWGAGALLAEALLSLPECGADHPRADGAQQQRCAAGALAGLFTIEVGAGSGIVSLCAARHGGARVLCTDLVDDALRLFGRNAWRNGIAVVPCPGAPGAVSTARLDWNAPVLPHSFGPPRAGGGPAALCDVLLGADVLFLGRAVRPIAALCAALLRPGGVALLSDPGRPTADGFCDACEDAGLRVRATQFTRLRTAMCDMPAATLIRVEKPPDGAGADGADGLSRAARVLSEEWFDALAADLRRTRVVPPNAPFAPAYTLPTASTGGAETCATAV